MAKEEQAMAKPVKPPRIWFATGSVNHNASKPLFEVGDHWEDRERMGKEELTARVVRSRAFMAAYWSGSPIAPEDVPRKFSLRPNRDKPSGPQPFMLFVGLYTIVTGETRALLERLGPEPLAFHPIEALNAAQSAPLWPGADLHLLQVLTCRRAVAIEESRTIGEPIERCLDGEAQRMVMTHDQHDALVVAPPAEGGPEIWIDDRLRGAMFLSDRIALALKEAGLTRGWGLKRCVTKTVH